MGNKKFKKKKKVAKKETKKHNRIEKELEKEKKNQNCELKMLLLGTGDSGKSTFIKQMQILYCDGFNRKDYTLYSSVIKLNCVGYIKTLLKACDSLGYSLSKQKSRDRETFLNLIKESPHSYTNEIAKYVPSLWEDSSMKKCFQDRKLFQIPGSADYFLDKFEEIKEEDYKPKQKDILICRIPTTGLKELNLKINGLVWKFVDVGGQRSERRKWAHHFDDVDILIFVIALDCYSQKLFENNTINRMEESLSVFENIVNNDYFKKKDLVILFNKVDRFEKSLENSPIKETFPDFNGLNNYEEGKEFFKNKFIEIVKKRNKRSIYPFFTCGIETNDMKNVFEEIQKKLIKKTIH
ncbi:guanine nucleotide-binding protein g(o) subunit alpha [Anaeramoeba flamelloides]|uniref:Guanine nucleotide-binding protein g(O) subunit alpha n=1 Tax=Anaeramoeba flamelloides TaxID=1746091 RepID=A0ABQ8YAT6_9EUKA|nr:guanine nucleotide-binding protein g(o) subunit alpha [Anaeramoeba flamelloides]